MNDRPPGTVGQCMEGSIQGRCRLHSQLTIRLWHPLCKSRCRVFRSKVLNSLWRGSVVVLGIEDEFDCDRVPMPLPSPDSCRDGQQCAVSLAIAPDARVPRDAVNDGLDGCTPPWPCDRRGQRLGIGAKVHPPLPGYRKSRITNGPRR
jgi:hypothetical protein